MYDLIGQTIKHYKIIEKLGEGGMGVVYKAEDLMLKRIVALKFLPPHITASETELTRFKQEAQAAAALSHPNITQIHAIEETDDSMFIVMEYLEGKELKEIVEMRNENPHQQTSVVLPLEDVINYSAQIAEGLKAAHKKGITHRDIKSSNIMITQEGTAKILDFGLAKMGWGINLTKAGTTLGTISYMSPEQVLGNEADGKSDIWAFGVVLYEMISGHLPFTGAYEQSIAYSIVNDEPAPLSEITGCPDYLEKIAVKCLQKDLTNRYQNFSDILSDLKNKSTAEVESSELETKKQFRTLLLINFKKRKNLLIVSGIIIVFIIVLLFTIGRPFLESKTASKNVFQEPHLAVLPISDIGGSASNQAFCNGLTEILTSKLTQLQQFHNSLWVIPVSEILKNNIKSPGEANKFFGVNLTVTGSLLQLNNIFRLTLNLIDAKNLRQLDSFVIDVNEKNLIILQDKSVITLLKMINLQLNPKLSGMLETGETNIPEAYEYYIQGRGYLQKKSSLNEVESAINAFMVAIDKDSLYAIAHAGLAQAYWEKYQLVKKNELAEKAVKEAEYAYKLNSKAAYINVVLGNIHDGTGKYDKAVSDFNRALVIDPVNYEAYQGLAKAYEDQGLLKDAESTYKRAISMQPSNWIGYHNLGIYYSNHSQYADAISQFKKEIEINPQNYLGFNALGAMYYYTDKLKDASDMFEKSFNIKKSYYIASNLGTIYYIQGKYAEAARNYEKAVEMNDNDYIIWGNLGAAYYWAPGERDKAKAAFLHAIKLGELAKKVNPNDQLLITMLAGYYSMVGSKQKALEDVSKSLKMAPNDAETMYRAGTTYEQLGDRKKAIEWIINSIKSGYSRSDIESQPELKKLIADERYKKEIAKIIK
jgi:serine/threonine-protein kinase